MAHLRTPAGESMARVRFGATEWLTLLGYVLVHTCGAVAWAWQMDSRVSVLEAVSARGGEVAVLSSRLDELERRIGRVEP